MYFFNPKIETMGNYWATFQKMMIWPPFSCFFDWERHGLRISSRHPSLSESTFRRIRSLYLLERTFWDGIRCLTKYAFLEICILHTACIWYKISTASNVNSTVNIFGRWAKANWANNTGKVAWLKARDNCHIDSHTECPWMSHKFSNCRLITLPTPFAEKQIVFHQSFFGKC